MNRMIKDQRGQSSIDTVLIILVVIIMLALALKVIPVMILKSELNSFAYELVRTAELEGMIGSETTQKAKELKESMEMDPDITWSRRGKIQLGQDFSVTLSQEVDIGFFEFGSFPIILTSKATGRSEVYFK